jgi:hypothetical protein
MSSLRDTLRDIVEKLSDFDYEKSFAEYRLWLDIGDAHGHITQDQLNDDIEQIVKPDPSKELIHPTAHLLIRFIGDVEADRKISRHASGLHRRRSTSAICSFFEANLSIIRSGDDGEVQNFLTNANLIARWANIGHVEEETIRNRILQSLIARPKMQPYSGHHRGLIGFCRPGLHDHQADALIILFKLAGATFEAYADPSVIDRCFELLKDHRHTRVKWRAVQVCTPRGERQPSSSDQVSGDNRVTGTWMGGSPSPTCVHHR